MSRQYRSAYITMNDIGIKILNMNYFYLNDEETQSLLLWIHCVASLMFMIKCRISRNVPWVT